MNAKRYALILATLLVFAGNKLDCRAFTHEGLTFEPISDSEVSLTHGDPGLTGELNVPGKMYYMGVNYTVSAIAVGAFADCVNLKSVLIPATINSIGNDAFNFCQSLNRIYIGGADPLTPLSFGYIPNLNAGLFADAHLESVYLGRNVDYNQRRGHSPFSGQKKLTLVEIGVRVTSLPEYLFADCTSLSEIWIGNGANPPTVGKTTFLNVDKKNCKIILRNGLVSDVATAPGWSEFENIMMEWESGIDSLDMDESLDVTVSSDVVNIKDCPRGTRISVLRLDGMNVTEGETEGGSIELRLDPGLYLLVIVSPNSRHVVKIAV